jgi:hypothetical protein
MVTACAMRENVRATLSLIAHAVTIYFHFFELGGVWRWMAEFGGGKSLTYTDSEVVILYR